MQISILWEIYVLKNSLFRKKLFICLYPWPTSWPRSRGSTGRTLANPLGWTSAPSVQCGNLMVSRCAVLLLLASCKGIWWILEQPRGSLLEHHPLMQQVFRRVRVWRQHVRMIEFAASTDKGTWLYSSTFNEYGQVLELFTCSWEET